MLQQECGWTTCPEMKAGEWLYLCVAHGADGAIEVSQPVRPVLIALTAMLCDRLHPAHVGQRDGSPKLPTSIFFTVCTYPTSTCTCTYHTTSLQIPPGSHRHSPSLARRLGRIFAHTYFHHRDIFAQAEAESSLYARLLALITRYDLVPPDFMVIPPTKVITDGEGDENDTPRHSVDRPPVIVPDPSEVQPPRLLAASLDPQAERDKESVQCSASVM